MARYCTGLCLGTLQLFIFDHSRKRQMMHYLSLFTFILHAVITCKSYWSPLPPWRINFALHIREFFPLALSDSYFFLKTKQFNFQVFVRIVYMFICTCLSLYRSSNKMPERGSRSHSNPVSWKVHSPM